MHKKDFIQTASIGFMPHLAWDVEQSIRYAEKLWTRLSDKGYGAPKEYGAQEIKKAYDKLTPVMKAAFDLFWLAFDHKQGKDGAAMRWLQLGELPKAEYERIIAGAKREAARRKNLPEGQIPIMAQGWLSERRWLDHVATATDEAAKQENARQQEMQKINQDLAAAKRMFELTKEQGWQDHIDRLTGKLRQLRDTHAKQKQP